MPTTNARYGRPKGSGVDDSRQLESIAALARRQSRAEADHRHPLARRRGSVRHPPAARQVSHGSGEADGRRAAQASRPRSLAARPGPMQPPSRRQLASVRTHIPAAPVAMPQETIAVEAAQALPQSPLLADWCRPWALGGRHGDRAASGADPALAATTSGRDGDARSARYRRFRRRGMHAAKTAEAAHPLSGTPCT